MTGGDSVISNHARLKRRNQLVKRTSIPRPLRGLMCAAAGYWVAWGFFWVLRDDVLIAGITSIVLGTTLLVLGLRSQDRAKGRSSPPAEEK